ncbi:MAG: invasion associated locus B family protein [Gammaproteobacteria bacterium]|nr:invasion associated locus B family protein [Gammaproteobacteria bacterium]NIR83630.1 invasion associated locus B family protein [Gammaproteobacteria bacterium]NIR91603.1 invasion associated locus B family protein [Gammaproteobacteria bacterium]NIU04792.1 invasion associated locus B family protein [Gammaproteobacteria bacterium]NIV53142.1 hypothetical protein [Gammaproteobacteria bacterium]
MRSPSPIEFARRLQILVLATSCLAATPLAAQDEQPEQGPEQDVQVYQDWRVRCESGNESQQRCIMFQNLVYQDSGQTVLSIQIGRNTATERPAAVFIVPLGVILPPGVSMEIDGGSRTKIDYQQCNRQSCIAPLPLNDTLLGTMKRGLEAQVTFHAVVQGSRRPITVPVSLKGFTAALNRIR